MMKIAKLMERYGSKALITLVLIAMALSTGVFYFYGLRAVNLARTAQLESTALKEDIMEQVIKNLAAKEDKLKQLKNEPMPVTDIFR